MMGQKGLLGTCVIALAALLLLSVAASGSTGPQQVKGKIVSNLGAGVVRIDAGERDGVKLGSRGRVFYYDELTRGAIYVADFEVTELSSDSCLAVITKGYVEVGQQIEWSALAGQEQQVDPGTEPKKEPEPSGPSFDELLGRADNLFESGKYADALQRYEALLKRRPNNTALREKIAQTRRIIEEEKRAEEERQRIESERQKIPTYRKEAAGFEANEEYGKALESLRKILEVEPDDAEAGAGIKTIVATLFQKGFNAYQAGNYEDARRWFEQAAEENSPGALYCLGIMYEMGQGVPRDEEKSINLIRSAAALGYSMAKDHIDALDRDVEIERVKADTFDSMLIAASRGSAEAQFNLGARYENGDGVERDYKEALKWYRMAGEAGFPPAQNNLGVMYLMGKGVSQNDLIAFKWFRKAADQGYGEAQNNMGIMFQQGRGIQKNLLSAVSYYRVAAEQGNAMAQYNLAFMYHNAQGVGRDIDEAVKWYRLAAAQGHEGAKRALEKIGQ